LETGWTKTTLGVIATKGYGLVGGPFGSNLPASCYVEYGIPVIRGSNLTLGKGRFNSSEFVYVSDETAERLSRSLAYPGDIIFTKKGTLGQTGIIPSGPRFSKYLLSSNQMKLSVSPEVANSLYVYYFVSTPECRDKIIRESTASGVPKTNVTYLRDFPIVLPPLTEQQAIARILGALDDKIELNRRMNRTFEAMAQALFKSWFVDFEPVIAKRAGRKPVGMDEATAALFPEHFQDSDMGPIPTGWRPGRVGEEFNLMMGQSPPGNSYNEDRDGLPFYQGRTDFGFRYPIRRVYCTAPTRFAEHGDTLVSVRAPVGDINMASERCCVGRGVAAVRHKSGDRSFTYYMMQWLREEFTTFEGDGTLFGAINKEGFHSIKMAVPGAKVMTAFSRITGPMDARVEVTELQIERLSALRDTLLPKLLSGELRVGKKEKILQEV
jgi:type I restriction enzyme, S subunit